MYELAGTYKLLAEKAGVEIRLNTEVTKEYAEKENADALIIAVGSTPLVPPIPGLNGSHVVIVNNYYLEKEKVGDEVVVFGGGLAGCECAIHLGMEGKKVSLVEMRDELAPDANVRHRPLLLKEIEKYVTVYTGEWRKAAGTRQIGNLCSGTAFAYRSGGKTAGCSSFCKSDWRRGKGIDNYKCCLLGLSCSAGYLKESGKRNHEFG